MYAVYQKSGSLEAIKEYSYVHTSTRVIIQNQLLGTSLKVFHHTCEGLARLVDQELEDILHDDKEIIIEFSIPVSDYFYNLQKLNDLWEEVNEVCKRVLPPIGCNEWRIEIEILEEERNPFEAQLIECGKKLLDHL